MCLTDEIDLASLDVPIQASPEKDEVSDVFTFEEKSLRAARAAFEKHFILKMLAENGGNISRTAKTIGLERSHLHKKMRSYGIDTSGNITT